MSEIYSVLSYEGNGAETTYQVTFPSGHRRADVNVEVKVKLFVDGSQVFEADGVTPIYTQVQHSWGWSKISGIDNIVFTEPPANASKIRISRVIDKIKPCAVYKTSVDITAKALNENNLQILRSLQEVFDDGYTATDGGSSKNLDVSTGLIWVYPPPHYNNTLQFKNTSITQFSVIDPDLLSKSWYLRVRTQVAREDGAKFNEIGFYVPVGVGRVSTPADLWLGSINTQALDLASDGEVLNAGATGKGKIAYTHWVRPAYDRYVDPWTTVEEPEISGTNIYIDAWSNASVSTLVIDAVIKLTGKI